MKPDFNRNALPSSQPVDTSVRGFTVIDLLVVLIQVSILAAIALPTFLSQADNAQEAEARIYIFSINNTQKAFYLEWQVFATQDRFGALGLGIPETTQHYRYLIRGGGRGLSTVVNAAAPVSGRASSAMMNAASSVSGATASNHAFIGGVAFAPRSKNTFLSTVCKATKPPVRGGDAGFAHLTFSTTSDPVCPVGVYRPIQPSPPR